MAKEQKLDNHKKGSPEGTELSKSEKIADAHRHDIANNLKQMKEEDQALKKEQKALENIEHTAAAAEKEVENLRKQLAAMEAQAAVQPQPAPHAAGGKRPEKKERKRDINPLNRIRHVGTRALSGVVALPSRVAAKMNHIVARPQQLVSGGFWKDLGKNILKTPGAILTTLSGAVYKPHRDKVKFEDNFKDYGPTFGPDAADKNRLVRNGKKALWVGGKVAAPLGGGVFSLLPKFFANIGRGMNHFMHETTEGIRDSKRHWNPKNRNFRPWKYSKTKEAFGKAFSWNKKGKAPAKVAHMHPAEHKKAA